jgi:large subunit ribosomal protein L23
MSLIKNIDKIKGLIYTEKSNKNTELSKYTFEVDKSCTKSEIKSLIKSIYKVEIKKINIINTNSKTKIFKGRIGNKSSIKKAVVSLQKNQTINFV